MASSLASMGDKAGAQGNLSVIITREVRWFFDGEMPLWFVEWFEALPGPQHHEIRSDVYDIDAAHQNVGLKRRSPANTLDCKMKLVSEGVADLGFGIEGVLEDWIKVTQPLDGSSLVPGKVEVLKRTISKRFFLDTTTGCEAEVAAISVGGTPAWTLCLETFGVPDLRDAAMAHGLEAMFGGNDCPDRLTLTGSNSHSYPEWLSLNHLNQGSAGATESSVHLVADIDAQDHESQAS